MAKHELTKALEIPPEVKQEAWERDGHKCLMCDCYVPVECACAHFIARSQLGKGIVENILTLCPTCHRIYDNSDKRRLMQPRFRAYLKSKHKDWNEKKLIYSKWEALYEV